MPTTPRLHAPQKINFTRLGGDTITKGHISATSGGWSYSNSQGIYTFHLLSSSSARCKSEHHYLDATSTFPSAKEHISETPRQSYPGSQVSLSGPPVCLHPWSFMYPLPAWSLFFSQGLDMEYRKEQAPPSSPSSGQAWCKLALWPTAGCHPLWASVFSNVNRGDIIHSTYFTHPSGNPL